MKTMKMHQTHERQAQRRRKRSTCKSLHSHKTETGVGQGKNRVSSETAPLYSRRSANTQPLSSCCTASCCQSFFPFFTPLQPREGDFCADAKSPMNVDAITRSFRTEINCVCYYKLQDNSKSSSSSSSSLFIIKVFSLWNCLWCGHVVVVV